MQLNKKLTDWLNGKRKKFLQELLEDDNGKRLAEAGFTLKVTVTASRRSGNRTVERELTESEWDTVTRAFGNQPEFLRFLRLLEELGNKATPFDDLRDFSRGWLDWSKYLYFNSQLRKRGLAIRLSYPQEQRRLSWRARSYRLYPIA